MPHFVGKVGVGGDDIDLGPCLLEFGIVVCGVFDFGRAIEGECCGHENQYRPLAFERLIRDLDEFAVVEGLCFERLDLGVDE
jgi:hypothetical protein